VETLRFYYSRARRCRGSPVMTGYGINVCTAVAPDMCALGGGDGGDRGGGGGGDRGGSGEVNEIVETSDPTRSVSTRGSRGCRRQPTTESTRLLSLNGFPLRLLASFVTCTFHRDFPRDSRSFQALVFGRYSGAPDPAPHHIMSYSNVGLPRVLLPSSPPLSLSLSLSLSLFLSIPPSRPCKPEPHNPFDVPRPSQRPAAHSTCLVRTRAINFPGQAYSPIFYLVVALMFRCLESKGRSR
jgi:hypothetical protein